MAQSGGNRQTPQGGGATTTDVSIGPVEQHVDDDEHVVYELEGSGELTFEDETADDSEVAGTDPTAVVTDRGLYLATLGASGIDVAEISYRNLRDVETADGILRRRFVVTVWDEGTYRFRPARGQPIEEADAFVTRASECWQRVLAAVENAREAITTLGDRLEAGEDGVVQDAREAAWEAIENARDRIDAAPAALRDTLDERVDTVETELQRTRVRANVKREQALCKVAIERADEEAWHEAETALQEAHRHAELARKVASLAGFPVVDAIDEELAALEERAADIASHPRKLGGVAQFTASQADDPAEAVDAWALTLERYRAAVTFDWGGRLGVDRDTDEIRKQVEAAATGLITARRELAERHCEYGDDARMAGDHEQAAEYYEASLRELSKARSIANELRAGDPAEIAADQERLEQRLDAVDGLRRGNGGASSATATDGGPERRV